MPKQNADRLTRREREIMNAIFELANRASAEEIRGRMIGPPSYSSVRVTLTRLEKKGCVKHQHDGVRYIYSATISPAAANSTESGAPSTKSPARRIPAATEATIANRQIVSGSHDRRHANQATALTPRAAMKA